MIVGSICSGIGAETLASRGLDWKVAFYSEIDKFPSAVLSHHFPDTPNLGDFTQIKAKDWQDVEIIVGGPPCQSFSIAGRRGGLKDNRGNLTFNYVSMCHDFADNGSLRWAFYENVPGILSDKTNAFGCLISGLVGADDPFEPPKGESWPKCGMASGPRSRLAWRVLDAQYFGLAQRRKRVFVVVGFADGCDPAKVLFERKGLRGDIAPRRGEGEGFAADAGKGAQVGSGHEIWPTLTACSKTYDKANQEATATIIETIPLGDTVGALTDGAHNGAALNGQDAYSGRIMPVAFNSRQDPVSGDLPGALDQTSPQAQAVAFAQNTRDEVRKVSGDGQIAGALAAEPGMKQQTYVAQPIVMASRGRKGGHNLETRQDGTANAILTPSGGRAGMGVGAVCHSIMPMNSGKDYKARQTEVAQPLMAGGPVGGNQGGDFITENYAVRRQTPIECARLQGFPDNWTMIPWRGKPAEDCPDGPQYKAYGNTWAVNCVAWIFARIDAVDRIARLKREAA